MTIPFRYATKLSFTLTHTTLRRNIELFQWRRLSLFFNVKGILLPLPLFNLYQYCFFGYHAVVFVAMPSFCVKMVVYFKLLL